MKRRKRLSIFIAAALLAIFALASPPSAQSALECSDDVINACHDIAMRAYNDCMGMGNSDYNCTVMRNNMEFDCYRVNNCRDN